MQTSRPAISAIKHGNRYLGVYEAPDGRRAVITLPATTEDAALLAAEIWVIEALTDELSETPSTYLWSRHPELEGFFELYRGTFVSKRDAFIAPNLH